VETVLDPIGRTDSPGSEWVEPPAIVEPARGSYTPDVRAVKTDPAADPERLQPLGSLR
jgi:hypothetical protein